MYIPQYALEQDTKRLVAFMKAYNFALLISSDDPYCEITPLPFVIKGDEDNLTLITHIANANTQWRKIDNTNVIVLFQGPHCYISPRYYESKVNVPTWNYTMVTAYGKANIFHERKKHLSLVHSMFEIMEPEFRRQWDELPEDYKEKLFNGIAGIEVKVEKLEGKFKLSQNKTLIEQKRIIEGLSKSSSFLERGVAEMMSENLK
jgi:transcriptional regulator